MSERKIPKFSYSQRKAILEKHLKQIPKGKITQEIKFVKMVTEKFDDILFWNHFSLGYKLNSFAYFLGGEGRAKLEKAYQNFQFTIDEPKRIELSDEKIGEDFKVKQKKKTLLELLNG